MKKLSFLKNTSELWKIVLMNIIFLFVFLELGSLGWYFFKYKQFFYTREKVTENNQGEKLENENENIQFYKKKIICRIVRNLSFTFFFR